MTLEERIVSLLTTAEKGSVALAAKLLQSVNNFDKELRIFHLACNDNLEGMDGIRRFHTLRYIEKGNSSTALEDSINFVGKRWIILLCPGDSVYLMRETWDKDIENIEI